MFVTVRASGPRLASPSAVTWLEWVTARCRDDGWLAAVSDGAEVIEPSQFGSMIGASGGHAGQCRAGPAAPGRG
jgi:hypothetical protein